MLLRSGRRYHPYRGRPKRSYRKSAPPKRKFRSRARATTSKYGKAVSVGFRGRKTSLRQFRNHLWRGTQFMTHYRSVGQGFTAPLELAAATPGNSIVYLLPALSVTSTNQPFILLGNAFWASGGGLQTPDAGIALPSFTGDITLRGGIARLMLFNRDDTQIRMKVYGVWAAKNPSIAVYTSLQASTRPAEFDPSVVADFADFGKILYQKEAVVDPFQNMEVVHRFKVQKIDRIDHTGSATDPAGSQLWWMVVLVCNQANPAASGINFVNSWNLSFSADAT